MLDPTRPLQILTISGSLRAASHNTKLLRALPALAPEGMAFTLFEGLADVPPYNADHDLDALRDRPDFRGFLLDMAFPANPFAGPGE